MEIRGSCLGFNALIAVALTALAPADSRQAAPAPPSVLFDGLFRDVADAGIFKDFKSFADAVPKQTPSAILADYRNVHPASPAALQRFVTAHFIFGVNTDTAPTPPRGLPLAAHIAALWPHLTRQTAAPPTFGSALPLPRPYVVPGGRFHELYYWDSYFTMLGFGPAQTALRRDMIADFVSELHTYGHIPNGNRTYYLSRSQPPFFFKMVALTAPGDEAKAFARFLPELRIEYAWWMDGSRQAAPERPSHHVVMMPDRSLLNRYWDERDSPRDESYPEDVRIAASSRRNPADVYRNLRAAAESGWDFSSRWLADGAHPETIQTADIVPADLNSILFGLEQAIGEGCARKHDNSCARDFAKRAHARAVSMRKFQWNGKWFDDYRWTDGKHPDHESAAMLYPLFVSLASAAEARSTAMIASADLVKRGGLVTTTIRTGQQWDAPNGWAPLQWIAVMGLKNYGDDRLARTVACRWLATVSREYRRSGKLVEKYDVEADRPGGGGEYPLQDGFGWTNGVTMALLTLYPHCGR